MARFSPSDISRDAIPEGAHVFKVVKAVERTSERTGYPILAMRLENPAGQRLSCLLTFCKAAEKVISAFCSSCGLLMPSDPNLEAILEPRHVLNRYVFAIVTSNSSEPLSEPEPRISRFISKETALKMAPHLASIPLRTLEPITLPVVRKAPLAL
jgi:hypothetical protein